MSVQKHLNNLILEDGENTDYIYSMITALFYVPSDGSNHIINNDTNNPSSYYVQEYIKNKFIFPIHRNMSIESSVVNKLRVFLYNCGWLKSDDKDILQHSDLDKFYVFLIKNMMDYFLRFTVIDEINNIAPVRNHDIIKITDKHIPLDKIDSRVIGLPSLVDQWIKDEVLGSNLSYKFEEIPYILPIYIDISDPDTCLNKKYINIMEGLSFPDNGDKIQRMLVWEFNSMICRDENGFYYSLVKDHNDDVMGFSDRRIPSNWKLDMTDLITVKKIMREVKFVIYKLQ